MKKILSIAVLLPLLLSCDKGNTELDATTGASIPPEEHQENNTDPASDGKTLIVFFSRAGENWQVGVVERGNTAIMADYIKEYTGADVFEIVPEVTYPQGYDETLTVATNEKNNNARPKFKGKIDNISQYGNVFIGGPVWWGEPPMIIHTFCEAYPELKDKTIILFGTHGGSGIGSYTTKLKGHFPNAKYLEALGISGASIRDAESKTKVENWLNKIGFEKEITNDMTISITASGKSTGSPWGNNNQDSFLESMAAAAQAVHNYFKQDGKDIIYINVMNNMSVDCDCDGHPASPKLKDMGILASTDPVALDQACLDLVFNHEDTSGDDAQPLQKRINSLHGTHITEYAEQIGLGSMKYNIVNIDK